MKQIDKYMLRGTGNKKFNYYFDKVTGLFIKSKRQEIGYPKKILCLRNDHIGDMVYSTQLFRELKKEFPKTKITVIATSGNRSIIEKDENVDEILEGDLFWRRGFKGFLDYLKILKKIRNEKFDVGIDIRRSKLNIIFFLFIPRIRTRISFYNINGGKAFLTHPILYEKKMNNVEDRIVLINKAFGLNIKNYIPTIAFDEEDEEDVKKVMNQLGIKPKKYVTFAAGATVKSKKWPEKKFNELIKTFHKKYPNYKIVLNGANSDKELINQLSKNRDYCVPLINYNLRRMGLIFKNARAVVANDGCGTDISWVAGANLITLVGGVEIETHKPLGKTKIIHHKLPCYPCPWSKPCKKPYGKWCMDLITVDEVMKALEDFINEK